MTVLTRRKLEAVREAINTNDDLYADTADTALRLVDAYARVLDVIEGEHIDERRPGVESQSGEAATYELGRLDVAMLVRAALEGKP